MQVTGNIAEFSSTVTDRLVRPKMWSVCGLVDAPPWSLGFVSAREFGPGSRAHVGLTFHNDGPDNAEGSCLEGPDYEARSSG
jgi:hypothetical protein